MRYQVEHTTRYEYQGSVSLCHNQGHLLPRDTPHQVCLQSELQITPLPTDLIERCDAFGNRRVYFSVEQPHQQQQVTMLARVQIDSELSLFETAPTPSWEEARDHLAAARAATLLEVGPFLYSSHYVPCLAALREYALPSFPADRLLLDAVRELIGRIHADFKYDPGFTSIATPLEEVLVHRRGVCQDFAHLALGCLRSLGLAARYVSGYLETIPPPGQERLVGADASHAWISVYLPDGGWVDFDPTNNQQVRDNHITVAWGRDFADVVPLKGVAFGGGEHKLKVAVDVQRLP
jgi:transglutaminase-like putative cysteine protease